MKTPDWLRDLMGGDARLVGEMQAEDLNQLSGDALDRLGGECGVKRIQIMVLGWDHVEGDKTYRERLKHELFRGPE
jgi:hypothetical protein